MRLVADDRQGTLFVAVEATRLDAAAAVRFKDEMRTLAEACDGDVVLDLSQVSFLDSSGLGALVSVMKQLGPGRRLELAGLTPMVARVFELTRMTTVFHVYPSAAEALATRAHAS